MVQMELFKLVVCPVCGGRIMYGLVNDVFCIEDNSCTWREILDV